MVVQGIPECPRVGIVCVAPPGCVKVGSEQVEICWGKGFSWMILDTKPRGQELLIEFPVGDPHCGNVDSGSLLSLEPCKTRTLDFMQSRWSNRFYWLECVK